MIKRNGLIKEATSGRVVNDRAASIPKIRFPYRKWRLCESSSRHPGRHLQTSLGLRKISYGYPPRSLSGSEATLIFPYHFTLRRCVRQSDEKDLDWKFLPACFVSSVQHRLVSYQNEGITNAESFCPCVPLLDPSLSMTTTQETRGTCWELVVVLLSWQDY